MGLFDFLGGKKKQSAPPAQAPALPLSAWQQALQQAEATRGFAWRDDNEPARAFVRSLLTQAAPLFGGGAVVDGVPPKPGASTANVIISRFGSEPMSRSDRGVELHGAHDGVPVRIPISVSGKRIWSIELRFDDIARYFTILRDHTRIPTSPDPNDPWAKGQKRCVFLGKGIFLDDAVDFLQQNFVENWATVPAAAQELVLTEMERLDLRYVALSNTDEALIAIGNPALDQLEDPIAWMQSCTAFLARFAKLYIASRGADPLFTAAVASQPVTCAYCTSRFILAAGKNTCPNCGAPAT